MPTFTGTSNAGQRVVIPIAIRKDQWFSIEIERTALTNLTDRWGSVIIGYPNAMGSVRVVDFRKLFGGGLFFLIAAPLEGVNGQFVLDWFRSDLDWKVDVPFALYP